MFKQGAEAYNKGDFDAAISSFETVIKQAKPGPVLEPIYYTIATAKLRKGDLEGAIVAFRLYLQTYPNGAQINDARAGITKALVAAKRMPEAIAAINSLRGLRNRSDNQGIDNYAVVLSLTLDIADSLIADKKHPEALDLLQSSLWRDQIIELQKQRILQLNQLYQRSTISTNADTSAVSSSGANRDALADRLKDARAALKTVEENLSFDIPRLLRIGQCYMELNQPWEAIVVYNEIMSRFPDSPDRAYALRGLVFAKQNVNLLSDAQALCQLFLDAFPSHPFAPDIAALGGQLSAQLQEPEKAAAFFGTAIAASQGPTLERVIFQLGDSRFHLRDWAGAREMFDRYVNDYPQGQWLDNAGYRSAISWLLNNSDADRYSKAEKAIKAFVDKNPSSIYLSDAYYRLAVCKFALQAYPEAISACEDWQKRFPSDGLLPQVISLKGDLQKTLGKNDDALATYLEASKAAYTDEVLSYVLNEIGRLLEDKRDWTRLGSVFTEQIDRAPDSPLALGWYYWVARAKARAGQPEEAWSFLAERIGPQLDIAANEEVEKILELMGQIKSRQRPPAGTAALDPAAELRESLKLSGDITPLINARISYYQSRILQLRRQPKEADALLLSIGRDQPPEKLSSALLAVAGEALNHHGDPARARLFFETLLSQYPKSDYRDYAYVGLGDLALAGQLPAEALQFYDDAIKKAAASHRLREATVGQARAHYALNHLDQAAKLFETIASAKQWRGEATALSLHHLGEIAVKQRDLPKGIVFFQRVFVSQVRYPEWVAKSYLACGQSFETLGKKTEAAATYREMLRNERIAGRPELVEARIRLKAIDPASQ